MCVKMHHLAQSMCHVINRLVQQCLRFSDTCILYLSVHKECMPGYAGLSGSKEQNTNRIEVLPLL